VTSIWGIKRGHLEEAGRWVVSFDFLEMNMTQVLTHAPWLHSSRKHLVKNEARPGNVTFPLGKF